MMIVDSINDSWSVYDKVVAQCQLDNYGKIALDAHGIPIDNEYELEEIFKIPLANYRCPRCGSKLFKSDL